MAYTYDDLLRLYQGGARSEPDSFGVEGTTEPSISPRDAGEAYQLPETPLVPERGPGQTLMQETLTPPEALGSPGAVGINPGVSAGQKQSYGQGFSVSAGGNGYNPETHKLLDKRDAILEAKKARSDAAVDEQYAPAIDAVKSSQASGVEAAKAKGDALLAQVEYDRYAAERLAEINQQIGDSEMKIHAQDAYRKNKAMADYQASLADFAASKVDPNDLWHGMSGGMRFGTMVTAFVHDFLGAKGIKTSAMDTLKGAIDRNINAQIQNINKKGEVARGFKTLYDMESARSSSAEETRARIRGYMLEAAKNHIIATGSQYKSLLATAEMKKGLAEVDKEFAKNYTDVVQHVEAASRARAQQDQQWEMHKAQMSMEGWRNSIAAKSQRLEELKYNDKQKADAIKAQLEERDNVLIDPESNKGKWIMKGGRSPTEMARVREAITGTADVNRTMADIRKLAEKVGGGHVLDEIDTTRFSSEDRRQFSALRKQLAHAMVKANGERATEADVKQYLELIPMETMLTNGGVKQILAYTQKKALDKAQDEIQQHTWDLPKEKWIDGASNRSFEKSYTEARASYEMEQRGGAQDQPTDVAGKMFGSVDGKIDEEVLKKAGYDKKDVNLDYGASGIARQSFKVPVSIEEIAGFGTRGGDKAAARASGKEEAPAWAAGIMILGEEAKKPGTAGEQARQKLLQIGLKSPGDAANANDPLFKNAPAGDLFAIQAYAKYKLLKFKSAQEIRQLENAIDQETAPLNGYSR